MNIISNSCFSGRFYQKHGEEFGNPFIWNQILPDDFKYLILNYDKINFNNYTIQESNFFTRNTKQKHIKYIYKIVLDKYVNVHFVHYRYDKNVRNLLKRGVDIYSSNIAEYVIDRYSKRTQRMLSNKEMPHFIITASEPEWTLEKQIEFCNLETNYKIILFSDFPEKLKSNNPNIRIEKLIRPIGTCDNMVNLYNDLVMKFFF